MQLLPDNKRIICNHLDNRSIHTFGLTCKTNQQLIKEYNINLDADYADIFEIPGLSLDFLKAHLNKISARYNRTALANLMLATYVSKHSDFISEIMMIAIGSKYNTMNKDLQENFSYAFSSIDKFFTYLWDPNIVIYFDSRFFIKTIYGTILCAGKLEILNGIYPDSPKTDIELVSYFAAKIYLSVSWEQIIKMIRMNKVSLSAHCFKNSLWCGQIFSSDTMFELFINVIHMNLMNLFEYLLEYLDRYNNDEITFGSKILIYILRSNRLDVYNKYKYRFRYVRTQTINMEDVFYQDFSCISTKIAPMTLATFEFAVKEFGWAARISKKYAHSDKITTEIYEKYLKDEPT